MFENNLRLALMKHVAVKKYPSETDPVSVADVSCDQLDVNTMLTETFDISTGKISCGCGFYEEMGIPCAHAIAAIRAVGGNAADPIWFDKGLSVESYICEYAAQPVSMSCIKLLSSTVAEMQPPHRIVKAGRSKKKKRFTYEPFVFSLGYYFGND